MMTQRQWRGPEVPQCPKRVWVMTALLDDEAVGEGASLSQAVRLHLAGCEACRSVADRLLRVANALEALGQSASPDGLVGHASRRALHALTAGARRTGRVNVPDDMDMEMSPPHVPAWRRYGPYAAAALILLSAEAAWIAMLPGRQPDFGRRLPAGIVQGTPEPGRKEPGDDATGSVAARPSRSRPDSTASDGPLPALSAAEEGRTEHDAMNLPSLLGSPATATMDPRKHRHRSALEVSLCGDPRCIGRGPALPATGGFITGLGRGFDTSDPVESTMDSTRLPGDK